MNFARYVCYLTNKMTITDDSLWAARRERARRWLQAGQDLRGYPALPAEEETEETLAATPEAKAEKKPKPQLGE
jgi:hypothetical protein